MANKNKKVLSKERNIALMLLIILDFIVAITYGRTIPLFIVAPMAIFNLTIVGIVFSPASDSIVKLYITQIEAMAIAFLMVKLASRISDSLCLIIAIAYLAYALWFYKSKIQKHQSAPGE